MASSADAATAVSRSRGSQEGSRWKRWLLLGACFGLGYGITQRLVSLQLETSWTTHQRFEVKPSPGTELNSLRRRFGDASMELRGDLDLLELERQQKRAAAAIEKRRSEMEQRERERQQAPLPADDIPAPADLAPEPLPREEGPLLPPQPIPELDSNPSPEPSRDTTPPSTP